MFPTSGCLQVAPQVQGPALLLGSLFHTPPFRLLLSDLGWEGEGPCYVALRAADSPGVPPTLHF